MENIDVQYQMIKNAMESELYEVATFIATKADAKRESKLDTVKEVISYLLKELAIKGRIVNTTSKDIQEATGIPKTDTNSAIKCLIDKDLITKYQIKSRTANGNIKKRKGNIVYSKANYTLVINESLVDLLNEKGFDINFDRSLIAKMHIEAMNEVETELIQNITKFNVTVTQVYNTAYDGSKTLQNNVDDNEIEQEKENAKREYEEKIEGLNRLQQENGVVKSIGSTEPLVDMGKLEEYKRIVEEEMKEEFTSLDPEEIYEALVSCRITKNDLTKEQRKIVNNAHPGCVARDYKRFK